MQSQIRGGRRVGGGGPGSRQQEPSRRGAGGNYLTTTRAPGMRGTAGAKRVEEEELSVTTRTLRAVEPARRAWVRWPAPVASASEASELESRVLTGEEATPHTPELRARRAPTERGAK